MSFDFFWQGLIIISKTLSSSSSSSSTPVKARLQTPAKSYAFKVYKTFVAAFKLNRT